MKKRKEFIIDFAYFAIIIFLIYVFGKYLLPVLSPFIVAFIFASLVKKIVSSKWPKVSNKVLMIILGAFYAVLFVLLVWLGASIVSGVVKINYVALYQHYIEPAVNFVIGKISGFVEELPDYLGDYVAGIGSAALEGIKNVLLGLTTTLAKFLTSFATSLPTILVWVIVMIVASMYMLNGYDSVVKFLKSLLPSKAIVMVEDLYDFFKQVIFKVLGSYILIMFITWMELMFSFMLLKVDNALLLAVLIAIMDILPILGTGTALIPWAITELLFGRILLGLGLGVAYITITIIRQSIEPKIVGAELGLTPLTTLVCMIVGLNLFGIVGMFGIPLALAFITYTQNKQQEANVEEASN